MFENYATIKIKLYCIILQIRYFSNIYTQSMLADCKSFQIFVCCWLSILGNKQISSSQTWGFIRVKFSPGKILHVSASHGKQQKLFSISLLTFLYFQSSSVAHRESTFTLITSLERKITKDCIIAFQGADFSSKAHYKQFSHYVLIFAAGSIFTAGSSSSALDWKWKVCVGSKIFVAVMYDLIIAARHVCDVN